MTFVRRLVRWGVLVGAALFLLAQAVPYGRNHTNPPARVEPSWDSQRTRGLAVRACFDCHSNETVWPWYAHVAPASWLLQRHVDEGRRKLNLSEWDRPQKEARESARTVRKAEMPPRGYAAVHRDARLSGEEIGVLARGFEATLGTERGGRKRSRRGDDAPGAPQVGPE